jgi:hypothetical protein
MPWQEKKTASRDVLGRESYLIAFCPERMEIGCPIVQRGLGGDVPSWWIFELPSPCISDRVEGMSLYEATPAQLEQLRRKVCQKVKS